MALAYGRAAVSKSAIVQPLNLRDQFIEHLGMRLGVDFTLENLLAQLLARRGDLLIDIRARRRLDLFGFVARTVLGFINDFVGAFLRLVDDFLRLRLGVVQTFADLGLAAVRVAPRPDLRKCERYALPGLP
jgi:hypothetical protein